MHRGQICLHVLRHVRYSGKRSFLVVPVLHTQHQTISIHFGPTDRPHAVQMVSWFIRMPLVWIVPKHSERKPSPGAVVGKVASVQQQQQQPLDDDDDDESVADSCDFPESEWGDSDYGSFPNVVRSRQNSSNTSRRNSVDVSGSARSTSSTSQHRRAR